MDLCTTFARISILILLSSALLGCGRRARDLFLIKSHYLESDVLTKLRFSSQPNNHRRQRLSGEAHSWTLSALLLALQSAAGELPSVKLKGSSLRKDSRFVVLMKTRKNKKRNKSFEEILEKGREKNSRKSYPELVPVEGKNYDIMNSSMGIIKAWTRGVPVDDQARMQLYKTASLPIVHGWVAAMPDVHVGKGATVGSVVPTINAVIPAAVGVDIGCGMMAVRTSLTADQLPEDLSGIRAEIEEVVPHGFGKTSSGPDKGGWDQDDVPQDVVKAWEPLADKFQALCEKHPTLKKTNNLVHLGTLGSGNHFIEVCLDEQRRVWVMLHSGSRGVGNAIGTHFIDLAKKNMSEDAALPDANLAYLEEGSQHFDDYVEAVEWAQNYARVNREVMMARVIAAMRKKVKKTFEAPLEEVNCHHNYISREHHLGKDVLVTRKGAVRARSGEMGIIPGSMGARSYIVRGLGNNESFHSCSHGAGRVLSRSQAKETISLEVHRKALEGVECRKGKSVLDETPAAYKPIEKVMEAQKDLVEIVHILKQVVCVKG